MDKTALDSGLTIVTDGDKDASPYSILGAIGGGFRRKPVDFVRQGVKLVGYLNRRTGMHE